MKNKIFMLLIAATVFVVGCKDEKIGNPDEAIANTMNVHSPTPEGFFVDGEIYGAGITERGVVYGRSASPVLVEGMTSDETSGFVTEAEAGAGKFTLEITGLKSGANYFARSYAKVGSGVIYGSSMSITTRPNPFFESLGTKGLMYGAVRKSDKSLAMHYSFDQENETVTVTYIESDGDRDAKHVTLPVTVSGEYTVGSWDEVSNGDVTVSGFTLVGSNATSVTGSAGLVLDEPFTQKEIAAMYMNSEYGGLNRLSELHGNHVSIDPIWDSPTVLSGIELSGEYTAVVGLPGSEMGGYLYRMNTKDSNGRPAIPQTEDRIVFSKGEVYTDLGWALTNEADIAKMETVLAPFYDFWYDPDGVIMVRATDDGKQVIGGAGTGDIYYYAISTTGEGWVYLRLRAYGQ